MYSTPYGCVCSRNGCHQGCVAHRLAVIDAQARPSVIACAPCSSILLSYRGYSSLREPSHLCLMQLSMSRLLGYDGRHSPPQTLVTPGLRPLVGCSLADGCRSRNPAPTTYTGQLNGASRTSAPGLHGNLPAAVPLEVGLASPHNSAMADNV